jgi:hypothetical protein|uniref:Uncharacterized protein n=1 Tax=viral metagenome TaxID=1070528 RepID=A0A6C0CXL7_9ZZZZ
MRSIFAKLPDELINIILEDHGGMLHREKMIVLKKELEREAIIKLMKRYTSFNFKDEWGYNEAERIINYFQNCQCCKRHQNNKPKIKELEEGFVPEYPTTLPKSHLCACPCRHYCREICREINDEQFEYDPAIQEIEPWEQEYLAGYYEWLGMEFHI